MNTTLPIKEVNLSDWRDTTSIVDPGYHYVITGTNETCGCINFKAKGFDFGIPVGIETTHGVVRMAAGNVYSADVPVIFVSPITDRFVRFDVDVTSTEKETEKTKKQNYVCSYKGGVALGCIMKYLNEKN